MTKKNATYNCIQGLRGFAALLIVLSHFGVINQGAVGNAIFFCISGFLAKSVIDTRKVFSVSNIKALLTYYLRKVLRIWPVYAVIISVFFVILNYDIKLLGLHLILKEGKGTLWFVRTILLIYFVWPFICFIIDFLSSFFKSEEVCRYIKLVLSVLFCIASYIYIFPHKIISMDVTGGFRLFQFMIGVCFGRAFDIIKNLNHTKYLKQISSVIGVIIAILIFLSSDFFLSKINPSLAGFYIGWELPFVTTVAIGILLLSVVMHPDTIIGRFFQLKLLTWYGAISFDLYLIHMFVYFSSSLQNNWHALLFTLLVSTCVAFFTHILIEKPFVIFTKTLRFSSIKEYYRKLNLLSEK